MFNLYVSIFCYRYVYDMKVDIIVFECLCPLRNCAVNQ